MFEFMAVLESSHVPFEVWLFLRLLPGPEKAEGASWLLAVLTLALACTEPCKHGAAWGWGWLLNEASSSVKRAPLRAGAEWRSVPGPSWGLSVQMDA